MPIIILFSDSRQIEQEIAKLTAETLGYGYLGREILNKISTSHGISEEKLITALEERPTFLGTSSKLWNLYLAYIQEAALAELLNDNIVCQGLGAHLYVLGVSHVLRIAVLSDPGERLQSLASQKGISVKKAQKLLDENKRNRRRWSMDAFNIDETDLSQYDLVINLNKIDPDEAVKIIEETVGARRFKPMTYSMKHMQDLGLAARARAALLSRFPDIRVRANSGTLVIETTALKREKQKRTRLIKEIAENINGVEYVEVHVINDIFRQAAESFR